MVSLKVNGTSYQADVDPRTPLLWVLRDACGLTGTKYGCGIAQCGACTVHIDGVATRSCAVPVSAVTAKKVTTIEGLSANGTLHKVQQAWIDNDVPQCGYCRPVAVPRRYDCGTERGQPKKVVSYAVPMVRIHLPPAWSLVGT